jgi:hypothetical protein
MTVGAWVEARRQDYWAGRLHPSCVEALESLPGWSWAGRSERRWAARYAALAACLTEHAGAMPAHNAMTSKPRIGEWATEQRQAHAVGNLPKPLAERLDTLPGWQWSEDCWQQGLTALRNYLDEHATLDDIDSVVEIRGLALGHWVKRCRDDYRNGSLDAGQIDDLESLPGWTWHRPDEQWRRGIAALHSYYLSYGSAQPPQKTVIDGFPIGGWVHGCRRDYQQGTLSAEHVAELEAVPTWAWFDDDATTGRLTAPTRRPRHRRKRADQGRDRDPAPCSAPEK